MGWIMGPLSVMGVHANGGTLLLYEGAPNTPTNDRVWELVERHRVAVLGVSPTLIRSLKAAGPPPTADLSSLRVFGASGEPWDEDAYRWLALTVGEGKRPLINFSGRHRGRRRVSRAVPGRAAGGLLARRPVARDGRRRVLADRRARARLGRRAGVQAAVAGHDPRRVPRPGALHRVLLVDVPGRLAPRRLGARSTPTASGTCSGARTRRSTWPANASGRPRSSPSCCRIRPSPRRRRSASRTARRARRSGASGRRSTRPAPTCRPSSGTLVTERLGKPFKPGRVVRVSQLPRTRSAKILRRAVRAVAVGEDPGDLSGAENPEALDVLREALA